MDDLDEELSKLKLLNSRPISPHTYGSSPSTYGVDGSVISGGKVAALANSFQQAVPFTSMPKDVPMNSQNKQISPGGHSPKKVGPIVPPKPQKPLKLPEVPQSMLVKQVCEPLYSKRLQCNSAHNDIDMHAEPLSSGRPSMLHRKQPSYATSNSLYSKINKVTLDNPAILEQQLEALAHHKLQLEKKGLLQHHGPRSPSYAPKLSTASFLNEPKNFNTNVSLKATTVSDVELPNSMVYSNFSVKPFSPIYRDAAAAAIIKSQNVYSNIPSNDQLNISNKSEDESRTGSSNMYNTLYENGAVLEDLPPPPPAVLSIANAEPSEYFKNQNDDEIPPPPSPVSSSYSELRRATDILSKIPVPLPLQQQQINGSNIRSDGDQLKSSLHYPQCIENTKGGSNSISGTDSNILGPQTYINMNYNNEYASFNESPSSQGSSTYESIYEPINPRPPSQLSSRSNYLMYVHYVNGPLTSECAGIGDDSSGNLSSLTAKGGSTEQSVGIGVSTSGGGVDGDKHHNPKEAEVKALTDYLVHSMDSSNDVDSYGVCVKCNERVVGENSGCTAMDQVYHISCFTCSQCQINLQGKPFYALESNPYCEYDYLQTLEKCSVCMKPILERILRATGKPYHPQCFTCVVCGNSLDGIPFTVDATNQNYCISDFHKKFAPRCCVCKQPIMPKMGQEETVRVVALDRSFHFECYKCEDCGLLLSSEAEGRGCYPLDDHVLCKSCNAKRVQMLTNRMTTDL